VDRCLLRYYRQKRIEEEVDRLLLPLDRFGDPSRSDSLREVYLPSNPFLLSEAGYAGPVVGLAEEDEIDGNLERIRREDGRVS